MSRALADHGASDPSVETEPIVVDFCGSEVELHPDESLTFGRTGDLVIDDNPFLHRRIGLINRRAATWWLRNVGGRIPMVVKDLTSRSQVTIAPGREVALSFPHAVIQFSAGRSNYELEVFAPRSEVDTLDPHDDGNETISLADLPLTDDQRRLILALAEPTLLSGEADVQLPANKVAAARLGWTITRFNRKLDNVCERLTKAGVAGLRGQLGETAADRRSRLVEHAIELGVVTCDDLSLIDSAT